MDLYSVGLTHDPTPEINQQSPGGSGKCPSLICLSVRLVRASYGLSVQGLRVVLVVSCLVIEKNITIRSQVRRIYTSLDALGPVGEMKPLKFFHAFFGLSSPNSRLLQPTRVIVQAPQWNTPTTFRFRFSC